MKLINKFKKGKEIKKVIRIKVLQMFKQKEKVILKIKLERFQNRKKIKILAN
jgi:hypothetical protein